MTKAVIIGASHWHQPLFEPGWVRNHEIVGVSDSDPERARELANRIGGKSSDDPWRLLDSIPEVDIVYALSPHDEMFEVGMGLVERRLPFMIEKPASLNLDGLRRLTVAANAGSVPVTVPLVTRNGPLPEVLSRVGEPSYFTGTFIVGSPSRYVASSPWMLDPRRSGGGVLTNVGVHFIDMFLRATGADPTSVRGLMQSRMHRLPIEDHASVLIETADGHSAIIEVGYEFPILANRLESYPQKRFGQWTMAGADGFVSVSSEGRVVVYRTDGRVEEDSIDTDVDRLYPIFVDQVAATLNVGFAGMPTLDELGRSMSIVSAAFGDARGTRFGASWMEGG